MPAGEPTLIVLPPLINPPAWAARRSLPAAALARLTLLVEGLDAQLADLGQALDRLPAPGQDGWPDIDSALEQARACLELLEELPYPAATTHTVDVARSLARRLGVDLAHCRQAVLDLRRPGSATADAPGLALARRREQAAARNLVRLQEQIAALNRWLAQAGPAERQHTAGQPRYNQASASKVIHITGTREWLARRTSAARLGMSIFSGDDVEELRDALVSAFPRKSELEQMVRTKLDVPLSSIADGEDLRYIAFRLIEWSEMHGREVELVEKAYGYIAGNRELKSFAEKFLQKIKNRDTIADNDVFESFGDVIVDRGVLSDESEKDMSIDIVEVVLPYRGRIVGLLARELNKLKRLRDTLRRNPNRRDMRECDWSNVNLLELCEEIKYVRNYPPDCAITMMSIRGVASEIIDLLMGFDVMIGRMRRFLDDNERNRQIDEAKILCERIYKLCEHLMKYIDKVGI